MAKLSLTTSVEKLPMVGPTYAKRLKRLEIETLEDLLYHFPHRHEDASKIVKIADLKLGESQTIQVSVVSVKNVFTKRGKRIQKAIVADDTGQLEVTWFNQFYLVAQLKKAEKVALSGKVDWFGNRLTMTAPEYEVLKGRKSVHTGRLVPVYPETHGVSSKWLRSRVAPILDQVDLLVEDWLPTNIRESEKLLDLNDAIKQIHFPESKKDLVSARKRLAFDELFLLQLASQKRKYLWKHKQLSHPLQIDQEKISQFIADLPFTLTGAQNKSVKQILIDLKDDKPMNRLLQGDVGSGKTVVAAIGMYVAYLNGLQSALMAPTEILTLQHAKTIKAMLEPLGLTISTQTGSTKDKLKSPDILVGTHALLHQSVPERLALLVVDEQHRFGVEQRARLLKAKKTPHLLSMTATPIPRTVALTVYGELEVSIIDEMPKGRKRIKTWVVPKKKRPGAYDWIAKQIKKHNDQAFVVCPLIEESESESMIQVRSAEKEYEYLKSQVYPKLKLGLLHGRMKAKQKKEVIDDFRRKKIDLLVSTPVIEVGIDIPNATIMMIEGAERFGLAQLHQLRGRVGRGEKQSYCLLFTSTEYFEDMKRLKAMETNDSGFRLAELDLELRGPGEMYGVKQHGFSRLKIARFSDGKLIAKTHELAEKLIGKDPKLTKYKALNNKLEGLLEKQVEPN